MPGSIMTGHLDRYGEPIEDDVDIAVPAGPRSTRDEIHRDRCAQLRAIIRAAKARREADQ
jgi:hypothetical protein